MNNTLNDDVQLSPNHCGIALQKLNKRKIMLIKLFILDKKQDFLLRVLAQCSCLQLSLDRLVRVGNKRNSIKMNTVVTYFKLQCI